MISKMIGQSLAKNIEIWCIIIIIQDDQCWQQWRGQGSKTHVDLIWKITSLWCQRFLRNIGVLLCSEVIAVSMCLPFYFSIVILGVIFDIFYTSFGYKNWNIETNTSKFCIDVHFNGLFWLKNFDLEICVNFGWFWQI